MPPPHSQQVVTWRATQIIYPSGDLDLWPFDPGTGVQCHPANVGVSATFPCRVMGQTRVKLTTWRYNRDFIWPLRTPPVAALPVLYFIRVPSFEFEVPKIWLILCVIALIRVMILIFDLLTSKWGLGSLVSWTWLLAVFSLLHPSVLDLGPGSGTGQTDRQTDRRTDKQRSSLHNVPILPTGCGTY